MWVIYLEMAIALAVLVLIVWFTWPSKRRQERPKRPLADKDAE
jgi:high-affinity Fe2+/Pb2+ permease